MTVENMGEIDHDVGSDTVPRAIGRLRVAVNDAFGEAARELGLSAQQAELLCAAMHPAAVGDIARVLRCDRSNVSRLVDRVALNGLVSRRGSDDDGRVTIIHLSAKGRRLAERFVAALEAQLEPLIQRWPGERAALAVEVLNEVADELDLDGARSGSRR